jgi:hypothetical protein
VKYTFSGGYAKLAMQEATMARPPKYASEEDKPVSVTLRLPRDLYDQAQQHAKRRQTTLTELVLTVGHKYAFMGAQGA